VLFVENAFRRGNVDGVFAGFPPGKAKYPVEVGAGDRVLRDRWRHLRKAFDLLEGDLANLIRQVGLLDLLAQIVGLRRDRIRLAQLTLNGADLFPEKEVALVFRHRAGDVVLNLGTERGNFELSIQQRLQAVQPLFDIGRLQQLLPLVQAEIEIRRDEVGEVAAGLGVDRGNLDLIRKRRIELDDFLELPVRVARQGRHFHRIHG
jgi:hypothetical protein